MLVEGGGGYTFNRYFFNTKEEKKWQTIVLNDRGRGVLFWDFCSLKVAIKVITIYNLSKHSHVMKALLSLPFPFIPFSSPSLTSSFHSLTFSFPSIPLPFSPPLLTTSPFALRWPGQWVSVFFGLCIQGIMDRSHLFSWSRWVFLVAQVSLPCSIADQTQVSYTLPFVVSAKCFEVSIGRSCLNLPHAIPHLLMTASLHILLKVLGALNYE